MSNDTTKSSVVVNDATASELVDAFRTLRHILAQSGIKVPEIPVEKYGAADYQLVCQEALFAYSRHQKAKREAALRHFRTGVDSVIRSAQMSAVEAKVTFDGMPAEVRRLVPAFPPKDRDGKEILEIPVAEFSSVFNGAPEAKIVATLKELNHKVVKSERVGFCISLPFPKVGEEESPSSVAA